MPSSASNVFVKYCVRYVVVLEVEKAVVVLNEVVLDVDRLVDTVVLYVVVVLNEVVLDVDLDSVVFLAVIWPVHLEVDVLVDLIVVVLVDLVVLLEVALEVVMLVDLTVS